MQVTGCRDAPMSVWQLMKKINIERELLCLRYTTFCKHNLRKPDRMFQLPCSKLLEGWLELKSTVSPAFLPHPCFILLVRLQHQIFSICIYAVGCSFTVILPSAVNTVCDMDKTQINLGVPWYCALSAYLNGFFDSAASILYIYLFIY